MITIFGAPGAGKTIQGRLLANKYGWEWISYRDLLLKFGDRDIIYALNHGMFIDDDKAIALMRRVFDSINRGAEARIFRRPEVNHQVILDGFPSDYRQVKWMINTGDIKKLDGAIVLRVPRGELWRRLVERKRVDDTRAIIERRQDEYDRNITGMIRTLTMYGVEVREVDGGNSPEDVLERIEYVLGDWNLIPKKQYEKIKKVS